MPELQRLRVEHGPAVLAFELQNRSYFAATVSDRGDEFYAHFSDHFNAALEEHEAGICHLHVVVDAEGAVLGRFNLYDVHDGTAVLGYRVAQHVTGRGVATSVVRELCQVAASQYGVRIVRAAVRDDNVASLRVLTKNGFLPSGSAEVGGRPGAWYELGLLPSGQ